jgi:hypothetical protein
MGKMSPSAERFTLDASGPPGVCNVRDPSHILSLSLVLLFIIVPLSLLPAYRPIHLLTPPSRRKNLLLGQERRRRVRHGDDQVRSLSLLLASHFLLLLYP